LSRHFGSLPTPFRPSCSGNAARALYKRRILSSGWELQYGWMIVDDHPGTAEETLKERYQKAHGGRLPALVSR